ncbi:MAG: hypothetical protein NC935_02175 [Candidatus Omnitrophica bacterium]|nr:hypothetical protein [Candidatus Omnitrophota bacterium]
MKKQRNKDTERELIELEHKFRMEEIEAEKKAQIEIENLKFDHQLQLQRIKSAEIRKTIQEKQNLRFLDEFK